MCSVCSCSFWALCGRSSLRLDHPYAISTKQSNRSFLFPVLCAPAVCACVALGSFPYGVFLSNRTECFVHPHAPGWCVRVSPHGGISFPRGGYRASLNGGPGALSGALTGGPCPPRPPGDAASWPLATQASYPAPHFVLHSTPSVDRVTVPVRVPVGVSRVPVTVITVGNPGTPEGPGNVRGRPKLHRLGAHRHRIG